MAITAADIPALGVQPFQVAPSKKVYPFAKNRDYDTYLITRPLKQAGVNFIEGRRGVDTDAVNPGGDALNYLCGETDPMPDGFGQLVAFDRTYTRIPATQINYPGSRYIPLPTFAVDPSGLSNLVVNTYPLVSAVSLGTGIYNSTINAIFTDYFSQLFGPTKSVGTRVAGFATAGTFTLTFGANTTTSLNWNDSGATIATALNALASITAAGLAPTTVSNALATTTGGGLVIQFFTANLTAAPVTLNAGSLTLSTSNHPTTQITNQVQQDILLPDHFTITAHALNTAATLAVVYPTRTIPAIIIISAAYWGSIDANTIWMPTASVFGNPTIVGNFERTYITGKSYLMRTRVIDTFYLPGVTPGITTPADIPTTLGLQDPSNFITALLTLSGWQTYDLQGPAFWMDGPIYMLSTTQINLDDI